MDKNGISPDKKLDFIKYVAGCATDYSENLVTKWLPDGNRQGREWVCLNPLRNDQSARSFSINLSTGQWADFATGDKGGDLVSLLAYLERCSQIEAALQLANELGIDVAPFKRGATSPPPLAHHKKSPRENSQTGYEAIMPVPDNCLKFFPRSHPKLGKPSFVWRYLDGEGHLLMAVCRFEISTDSGRKKEYRPLSFGPGNKPGNRWNWKQPTKARPLYGLDRLAAMPESSQVILCEGEKAADAAQALFPSLPCLTWPGGGKAVDKADWQPLEGREILFWPDNDSAGAEAAARVKQALEAVHGTFTGVVNLASFERYAPAMKNGQAVLNEGGTWPEKSDAHDAVSLGWDAPHIELLKEKGRLIKELDFAPAKKSKPAPTPASSRSPEGRFKSDETGLYYLDLKSETFRRIGGRLDVLARSRNQAGRSWGLLVSFDDFDHQTKELNIPLQCVHKEGGNLAVDMLVDRGYPLLTGREPKKQLLAYLGDHPGANRVRLVERMGWHGSSAFMLPDRVIGTPAESLHYYTDLPPLCKMQEAGTLEQWRENVAAFCPGNDALTFAVSAAFTAPLLDTIHSETCGFHFVGDSSLGKSTLLKVAASVYGHPDHYPRTWRATDNALEATASAHSDCLLILDEIGQIEPRIVGETIYMLGNGEGKTRATETGALRGTSHSWRLVFLSSGEKTLFDHMAEAHKKPQAGMELRLLTIPACPHDSTADRKHLGIYKETHGFDGGAALSSHLLAQTSQHYGTALAPFLEYLISYGGEQLVTTIHHRRERIKTSMIDQTKNGQVSRTADKFALVAIAGELATMAGITGWQTGEATKAAEACFRAWLNFRGGSGNVEDKQALEHVRLMLVKYGRSRFDRWDSDEAKIDEHSPRTMDRWGFRKIETDNQFGTTENIFFLEKSGFTDLCKGFDHKRVARLLYEADALITDSELGRLTKKTRLPEGGKRPVNCYVIKLSALLSDSEPEPGEPKRPPPTLDAVASF